MSFNYANAHDQIVTLNDAAILATHSKALKAPAVVDVTGMEMYFGLNTTEAAASASIHTMTAVDGSASGDAVATTATLLATITNGPSSGTGWTAYKWRGGSGTSTTDLDADDSVNIVKSTVGTASSGAVMAIAYIHGKPAVIN